MVSLVRPKQYHWRRKSKLVFTCSVRFMCVQSFLPYLRKLWAPIVLAPKRIMSWATENIYSVSTVRTYNSSGPHSNGTTGIMFLDSHWFYISQKGQLVKVGIVKSQRRKSVWFPGDGMCPFFPVGTKCAKWFNLMHLYKWKKFINITKT